MTTWESWARAWLSGKDRSAPAAWAAARAAEWAAEAAEWTEPQFVDILSCARRAVE